MYDQEFLDQLEELIRSSPQSQELQKTIEELRSELLKAQRQERNYKELLEMSEVDQDELKIALQQKEQELEDSDYRKVSSVPEYLKKIGVNEEEIIRGLAHPNNPPGYLDDWAAQKIAQAEKETEPTETSPPLGELFDNDCDDVADYVIDNDCDEPFDDGHEVAALVPAEKSEPPRGFWGFIFRWMFKISFWRR